MAHQGLVRIASPALLAACLAACATTHAFQGHERGGVYTAPDGEFSVTEPVLPGLTVDDAGREDYWRVQFTDSGLWPAAGGYVLEWDKLDKPYEDVDDFYTEAVLSLPRYINSSLGVKFRLVSSKRLKLGDHAAQQVVMLGTKDRHDTYCVATAIDFYDRRAIAILLIPVPSQGTGAPEQGIPWDRYGAFVASIRDDRVRP